MYVLYDFKSNWLSDEVRGGGVSHKDRNIIWINFTYCQVRLLLIPSRKRSRNERCRLGPDPVIIWWLSLGDELKNFVGLKCCCDSELSEWDGDDDLKPGLNLLNGELRCFGDCSSRDAAIFVYCLYYYYIISL